MGEGIEEEVYVAQPEWYIGHDRMQVHMRANTLDDHNMNDSLIDHASKHAGVAWKVW